MPKATADEVGQGYDALADMLDDLWSVNLHHGYWDDEFDATSVQDATHRLTDRLAGRLTIRPGDRLLDLGCGIGEPALRLAAAHDIEVVGITVSRRQVERATVRAAEAGLADRLSFQLADAMDVPFPDASFDIVWALESLHHMPDRAHVLGQAARVLRPGGQVAIGDFVRTPGDGDEQVHEADEGILSIVALDEYGDLLRTVGLEPETVEDVSAHTRRSWAKAADVFATAREQAGRLIGAENFDGSIARMRRFSELSTLGYALLTARKPD